MANLANELSSMDFSNLIGGPMKAAVEAQNMASLAQIHFIQEVGMTKGQNEEMELSTVEFVYSTKQGENNPVIHTISVPVLTMLNVPSLRIDEMTIDFNAKLTSVETTSTSTDLNVSAELSASYMKMVSLKASAAYQKKTSATSQVERTYSMVIHVRVVNDELPAGLDRLLTMLEEATTVTTPEA